MYRGFKSHPHRAYKKISMKIYLIRHGQTTGDIAGLYGGTYDDHLSAKGLKQAKELALDLRNKNIEIIYSSPYNRAKDTAESLAKTLKCPIKIKEDLRERNVYGFMSGESKEKMKEKFPEEFAKAQNYRLTVRGGEEYADFKKRILAVIDEIVKEKYDTVAVVSHGGPIRCFHREILNSGNEIEPRDCEVLEIEYRNNRYILI